MTQNPQQCADGTHQSFCPGANRMEDLGPPSPSGSSAHLLGFLEPVAWPLEARVYLCPPCKGGANVNMYWAGQLMSHGTGPAESYQTQGCAHMSGPLPPLPPPASLPNHTCGPWIPVGALFRYLSTRDTSPKAPSKSLHNQHNSWGSLSSPLRKKKNQSSVRNSDNFLTHFPSHTAYLRPRSPPVLLRPV